MKCERDAVTGRMLKTARAIELAAARSERTFAREAALYPKNKHKWPHLPTYPAYASGRPKPSIQLCFLGIPDEEKAAMRAHAKKVQMSLSELALQLLRDEIQSNPAGEQ